MSAPTPPAPRPILFAYDGSEQAKSAIREAGLELRADRPALVLTVWPLATLPFETPARAAADLDASLEREAQKVADEGAALATSVGFDALPLIARGEPTWRVIVDTADDYDASILVMGSHRRSGIALALMGSVAGAVGRHSERPVLTAQPRNGDGTQ